MGLTQANGDESSDCDVDEHRDNESSRGHID